MPIGYRIEMTFLWAIFTSTSYKSDAWGVCLLLHGVPVMGLWWGHEFIILVAAWDIYFYLSVYSHNTLLIYGIILSVYITLKVRNSYYTIYSHNTLLIYGMGPLHHWVWELSGLPLGTKPVFTFSDFSEWLTLTSNMAAHTGALTRGGMSTRASFTSITFVYG